jgi:hypothetical protein
MKTPSTEWPMFSDVKENTDHMIPGTRQFASRASCFQIKHNQLRRSLLRTGKGLLVTKDVIISVSALRELHQQCTT